MSKSLRTCFTVVVSSAALLIVVVLMMDRSNPSHSLVADGDVIVEPMVLTLNYWEQTANTLKNLLDLQCWAKSANISKVVEPSFIGGAFFGSGFGFTTTQSPKLGDLYDITEWNKMSVGQGYSSLGSLQYFLKYAVKEVVYVHIKYAYDRTECHKMKHYWRWILWNDGFRVVKVVCIDFATAPSHIISDSSFRDSIFHGIGHNVTVLFNQWRGVRTSERVALNGSKCINCLNSVISVEMSANQPSEVSYVPLDSISPLTSSLKIDRCIDWFLAEHLHVSGGEYIAVMLRSEKLKLLELDKNSCASGIISDWKKIVQGKNTTKTLFFSDIGKYGSKSAGWRNSVARNFAQHIHDALNLHLTLDKMNSILRGAIGSSLVQMAVLHQQLVARATCVLVIGGGSFQMHTLNAYAHQHRGQECYVFRDGECEKKYIFRVYGQKKAQLAGS